jgi:hypothetical protein
MTVNSITLALSTHRPETLPFAETQMLRHEAIFLEEPAVPEFGAMLEGALPVEDYVMLTDTEYPEFASRFARLLQKLHRRGKRIFQIEPFLDELLAIHEHLAEGGRPKEFEALSTRQAVYASEKKTTGRLLAFYASIVESSFGAILQAVQNFARADAARFRLRDQMRAGAIAERIGAFRTVYVEAGDMHLALWGELRKRISPESRLRRMNLMAPVVKKICGRNRLWAPGDQLTAHYLFCGRQRKAWEELMAARSLVYNKILPKDERIETPSDFPHTLSEIDTIRTVRLLSIEDCRKLFEMIRYRRTEDSRITVADYLAAGRGGAAGSAQPPVRKISTSRRR